MHYKKTEILARISFRNLILALVMNALFSSCAHRAEIASTAPSLTGAAGNTREIALPLAWVELGPAGTRIARAITYEGKCPTLTINGKEQRQLTPRASPESDFPVLTCETVLESRVRSAVLGSRPLPLPPRSPRKIVVLGDTGCRVSEIKGKTPRVQDCASTDAWPFAKIAAAAAALRPDLVVHVGDYLYRETKRGDSPHGDRYETWVADFFAPGRELLEKTPWAFVRGNHEDCARSYKGWFRFLDPRLYASACLPASEPYWIKLGRFEAVVLDSSSSNDTTASKERILGFEKMLSAIKDFPVRSPLLFTHKPIWSPEQSKSDLVTASEHSLALNRIAAAFVGHLHVYGAMTFADTLAPQFFSGNGGTALVPEVAKLSETWQGAKAGQRTIDLVRLSPKHGFFVLERGVNGTWNVTEHGVDGKPLGLDCSIQPGHKTHCR